MGEDLREWHSESWVYDPSPHIYVKSLYETYFKYFYLIRSPKLSKGIKFSDWKGKKKCKKANVLWKEDSFDNVEIFIEDVTHRFGTQSTNHESDAQLYSAHQLWCWPLLTRLTNRWKVLNKCTILMWDQSTVACRRKPSNCELPKRSGNAP